MSTAQQRRRGRPAMGPSVMERVIPVRVPEELLAGIDGELEARGLAAPSRSQLIRELLVLGLNALKERTGGKRK